MNRIIHKRPRSLVHRIPQNEFDRKQMDSFVDRAYKRGFDVRISIDRYAGYAGEVTAQEVFRVVRDIKTSLVA